MKTDKTAEAVFVAEMALLDRLHFAFKAEEQACRASALTDIALGYRRARGTLDAVRGDIHRKYDESRTALRRAGGET